MDHTITAYITERFTRPKNAFRLGSSFFPCRHNSTPVFCSDGACEQRHGEVRRHQRLQRRRARDRHGPHAAEHALSAVRACAADSRPIRSNLVIQCVKINVQDAEFASEKSYFAFCPFSL